MTVRERVKKIKSVRMGPGVLLSIGHGLQASTETQVTEAMDDGRVTGLSVVDEGNREVWVWRD